MSALTFILHKNVVRELYDISELEKYILHKFERNIRISNSGWGMIIDFFDGKYYNLWYSQDDEFLDRAKAEIDKLMDSSDL